MDLAGKHVVITGASQGVGAALARSFAGHGARVLLVARSTDKLAALAQELGAMYLVADLADPAQVDALAPAAIDKLGHVDVLVNNAGVDTAGPFNQVDRDALRQLARVNFEAPMLLTRDFVAHMLPRGIGHIVQLSSVAGTIPFVGQAAYSGSKAGLTNLTETIRLELASTPIGFTVVAPGPIATNMFARIDSGQNMFMAPVIRRFRQVMFLPTVRAERIAEATCHAVQRNRRFVRIPARYTPFYWLNIAPRRMVELTLAGVRLKPTGSPDQRGGE